MLHWQHAKRWLLVVVTVSYIAGTPQTMRTVAILLVAAVGCHGFNFLSKPKPAATASKGAKPPPKAKAVAASTKGIKKVVAPPKGKKAAPAPATKKPAFANPFAAKSKAAPAPAKKGGFSFGGAKPAAKAKKATPPPPKPSKKAPPPKAKAPPPTFNKPKRQSQGAPGTPGGIQFAPSKPQARSSGRKFDEFLYDPNDELAKARAAFGKK